ncbi:MAG TPA: alpha/beta hydrolase-fold protein [Fontimonas sp.]
MTQAQQRPMRTSTTPAASSPAPTLSLRDASRQRLARIERFELDWQGRRLAVCVALPAAYGKSRRRRFPLLMLSAASDYFGAAVEMSRVLAGSQEVEPCIVVDLETSTLAESALLAELAAHCAQRYRVRAAEVCVASDVSSAAALLSLHVRGIAGVSRCIVATPQASAELQARLAGPLQRGVLAWTVLEAPPTARDDIDWNVLPEASAGSLFVPALVHGLRRFWGRDHRYGDEVIALAHPLVARLLRALTPALRPFTARSRPAALAGERHILRAQRMGRDFEVFVTVPDSAAGDAARRYPAILALDANGGFATVAEIAAGLARAGDIPEAIVIGVGTPRSEGELEFGYRRFEELSPPPAPGYRYDDALGRFFRSAFALRGEDAREQLGRAPAFHDFLANELLPKLGASLPIAAGSLCLLGHSAGGTFVAYAAAQPRSPFRDFLCLSPGVAISGDWMLQARNLPPRRALRGRVICAIGDEELDNRFNRIAGIPQTLRYVDALRDRGIDAAACQVLGGESHTSVYARAVAMGLRAVLAPAK